MTLASSRAALGRGPCARVAVDSHASVAQQRGEHTGREPWRVVGRGGLGAGLFGERLGERHQTAIDGERRKGPELVLLEVAAGPRGHAALGVVARLVADDRARHVAHAFGGDRIGEVLHRGADRGGIIEVRDVRLGRQDRVTASDEDEVARDRVVDRGGTDHLGGVPVVRAQHIEGELRGEQLLVRRRGHRQGGVVVVDVPPVDLHGEARRLGAVGDDRVERGRQDRVPLGGEQPLRHSPGTEDGRGHATAGGGDVPALARARPAGRPGRRAQHEGHDEQRHHGCPEAHVPGQASSPRR